MKITGRVMGLTALVANVRKNSAAYRVRLVRGLLKAGLFVQAKSQRVVPIDENVLRPSANTREAGSVDRPEVIVSYGTEYAIYVHERTELRHKAGKQAKFLSEPLLQNQDKIRLIVGREIKKKI